MYRIGRVCLKRPTKYTFHTLGVFCIVCAVCIMLCSCGAVNDPAEALPGNETGQAGTEQAEDQIKLPEGNAEASGDNIGLPEGDTGVEELQQNSDFISGTEIIPGRQDYHLEAFGGNVYFFAPEDDPKEVQCRDSMVS